MMDRWKKDEYAWLGFRIFCALTFLIAPVLVIYEENQYEKLCVEYTNYVVKDGPRTGEVIKQCTTEIKVKKGETK